MDLITFEREFGVIIIGAVIFIASFLWKDFLGDVEDIYFPKQQGLFDRFLFVIIVTVMLITIVVYLKRIFGITDSTDIIFDDSPLNNTSVNVEEFEDKSKKLKIECLR